MRFNIFKRSFVVAFLGLVMVGCANNQPLPAAEKKVVLTPEQTVVNRAQARWDALIAGNMESAYQFISPGGRVALPLREYRLRVNSQYWLTTTAKDATCEPELCEVRLDFNYQINGLKLHQVITEQWILDGGEWWFVYRG